VNRGLRVGLFGVLLLAVLVIAGIVASQVPRESASISSSAQATNSGPPVSAGGRGGTGVMTMSPVKPVGAVSPRPPSSAGPVAVRVLPTETTAPTPAPSAQNFAASPAPLATFNPQALPSIVLAQNGLP